MYLDDGHYDALRPKYVDDIQATRCWLITTESCLYFNSYEDYKQILFIEINQVMLSVDLYEFLCVRHGTRSGSSPSLFCFFPQILRSTIATLLSATAF